MATAHDLLVKAADLDNESGKLEAQEVTENHLAALWEAHDGWRSNSGYDYQMERDWHLTNAFTYRRRAKKLRKRSEKLYRRARRIGAKEGINV